VLVKDFDEALSFAQRVGYPVVLKVSSAELLHKKDKGGVITNIDTYKALEDSYRSISENFPQADIVIQEQMKGGVEVIVGVKRDPGFGNVLMFGAGGTLAELIEDRNLHLLPVSQTEVETLVNGSKIYKILSGYRGDKPYALE